MKAEWQIPDGSMLTRWAKDVDPTNVLPEYPLPQLFAQLIRELKNTPDRAVTKLVREVRDGNW
jgi:hypothetical protein